MEVRTEEGPLDLATWRSLMTLRGSILFKIGSEFNRKEKSEIACIDNFLKIVWCREVVC